MNSPAVNPFHIPANRRFRTSWLCVYFLLLLFICIDGLTAKAISLQFVPYSSEVEQFRYQVNDVQPENWLTVTGNEGLISLEQFDRDTDVLYLQQYTAEDFWGEAYPFIYNRDDQRWEFYSKDQAISSQKGSFSLLNVHSLEVRGQYSYPFGYCSEYYGPGFGAVAKLNFFHTKKLLFTTNLSYQKMSSNTSWVSSFHEVGISLGLAIPFYLTEFIHLQLELSSGAMLHLVHGDVSGSGAQDLSLFVDPLVHIAATVLIDIQEGLQLSLSPGIVWFLERGAVGQAASLQAGLRMYRREMV